jgi:tetratricopeptide (TPR) repeat protein
MPTATSATETNPGVKRKHRSWPLQVAFAIVLPLLILGGMEWALRFGGIGFPTELTVPCTVQGRAAACYNLFFPAPFFPPGMIKTPQAYAIPVEKAEGTFRIFVLGESAAMGDPDPAYSFSRYLEVMLRQRYPATKFEVVNTGSVAINSHVLLPIARGLAQQQPDLFIIYSGNNEVVGPYGPGTALASSGMSMPVIRSSIFVRSTHIGQLLTKIGTQKREWGGMEMFLDKQVRESSPLMKYTYENYEKNLRDTVDVARASGARVIVSTVATNLKDCGPFGSLHRENLTTDDLRSFNAFVVKGDELETARDYGAAMAAYAAALKIDDQFAEVQFRMARMFWKQGDYGAARSHFLRARDLDTLRFRADSRINEINRVVGQSEPGAELVDADAILSKESAGGITGSEMVYEHVHMTPRANYVLARAMFSQITSKLPPSEAGSQPEVLSETECEQLLALTQHDRSRIANEMLERLQKPPFTTQMGHSEQVLRLTLQSWETKEDAEATASQYEWAIRQRPDDRILHYNYGLFLYEQNRAAGMAELRLSRPWDGFPVFAPDGAVIQ